MYKEKHTEDWLDFILICEGSRVYMERKDTLLFIVGSVPSDFILGGFGHFLYTHLVDF